MHNTHPREIEFYRTQNGRTPFTEWLETLRDRKTQTTIRGRLTRLELGNLGDFRSVGEGVNELRIHYGPGYRIYFAEAANTIILLLCGGDKSSQQGDVERAKRYWQDYKERQQ